MAAAPGKGPPQPAAAGSLRSFGCCMRRAGTGWGGWGPRPHRYCGRDEEDTGAQAACMMKRRHSHTQLAMVAERGQHQGRPGPNPGRGAAGAGGAAPGDSAYLNPRSSSLSPPSAASAVAPSGPTQCPPCIVSAVRLPARQVMPRKPSSVRLRLPAGGPGWAGITIRGQPWLGRPAGSMCMRVSALDCRRWVWGTAGMAGIPCTACAAAGRSPETSRRRRRGSCEKSCWKASSVVKVQRRPRQVSRPATQPRSKDCCASAAAGARQAAGERTGVVARRWAAGTQPAPRAGASASDAAAQLTKSADCAAQDQALQRGCSLQHSRHIGLHPLRRVMQPTGRSCESPRRQAVIQARPERCGG